MDFLMRKKMKAIYIKEYEIKLLHQRDLFEKITKFSLSQERFKENYMKNH